MNMTEQTDIEGTIRLIDPVINTIKIDNTWYDAGWGLVQQAMEYFPPGTPVKAGVIDRTPRPLIKSLVKQEPLIG
jgi:hypothetical protein